MMKIMDDDILDDTWIRIKPKKITPIEIKIESLLTIKTFGGFMCKCCLEEVDKNCSQKKNHTT